MSTTYGPVFRWFAWHPVKTTDRGWRWLRLVYRRREFYDVEGHSGSFFRSSVTGEDWS